MTPTPGIRTPGNLTIDEAERLHGARTATADLAKLLDAVPEHVAIMRRCMNGQPQAAAYDRTGAGSSNVWCEAHERPVDACYAAGEVCAGVPPSDVSDPTGNAALVRDSAAADLRAFMRELDHLARAADRLRAYALAYPTRGAEVAAADGPGGDYCSSCWRDDRYHEPVTLSPAGIPYYVGRCRWCGTFKANEGMDPPLMLLRARHQGRRVTSAMVATALAAATGHPKGRNRKGKGKGSRR